MYLSQLIDFSLYIFLCLVIWVETICLMLTAYHHFDEKILTAIFHTKMNPRYKNLKIEFGFVFDVFLIPNYVATIFD